MTTFTSGRIEILSLHFDHHAFPSPPPFPFQMSNPPPVAPPFCPLLMRIARDIRSSSLLFFPSFQVNECEPLPRSICMGIEFGDNSSTYCLPFSFYSPCLARLLFFPSQSRYKAAPTTLPPSPKRAGTLRQKQLSPPPLLSRYQVETLNLPLFLPPFSRMQ